MDHPDKPDQDQDVADAKRGWQGKRLTHNEDIAKKPDWRLTCLQDDIFRSDASVSADPL